MPRVHAKLRFLHLRATMDAVMAEITSSIHACCDACDRLVNSTHLASLLRIILSLGNALNDGTTHVADGFKMDTLPKLSEVYSSDNKTSLLQYVVETVKNKTPEVQKWTLDMPAVQAALEANCESLPSRVNSILSEVAAGENELQECDDVSCHVYSSEMNKFLKVAQKKIPLLQNDLEKARAHVKTLLRYFGEESSGGFTEAENLFMGILAFGREYEKVRGKDDSKRS